MKILSHLITLLNSQGVNTSFVISRIIYNVITTNPIKPSIQTINSYIRMFIRMGYLKRGAGFYTLTKLIPENITVEEMRIKSRTKK